MSLKKVIYVCMVLIGSSCAPYLIYMENDMQFQRKEDTGIIVLIRTVNKNKLNPGSMNINGTYIPIISNDTKGIETFHFLSGKYVGGLRNNCMSIIEATPGEHLLISHADFYGKMKINIEAGKIYYIEEIPFQMGPLGSKSVMQPLNKGEALEKIRTITQNKTVPNPEKMKNDLSKDRLSSLYMSWEKWAEKNPDKANKELSYKGY